MFLFFCYYEYLCTSRACILFSWEWGVEWLDHVVGVIKCFLSILRKCQAVIKVVIPSFIPTSLVWEFHCFYILSNPWDGQSFLFCSSNGWVMVSHFGFKLFFPVLNIFHVFNYHLFISFGFNPLPVWPPTPVLLPGKFHGQRSPTRLQSMGSQKVGHDWATSLHFCFFLKCTVYFLCYWILRVIYSRYKTIIRYMICKYFLLVCGWFFTSLHIIL